MEVVNVEDEMKSPGVFNCLHVHLHTSIDVELTHKMPSSSFLKNVVEIMIGLFFPIIFTI